MDNGKKERAKRKWKSRHEFRFAPEVTRKGKKKDVKLILKRQVV